MVPSSCLFEGVFRSQTNLQRHSFLTVLSTKQEKLKPLNDSHHFVLHSFVSLPLSICVCDGASHVFSPQQSSLSLTSRPHALLCLLPLLHFI